MVIFEFFMVLSVLFSLIMNTVECKIDFSG